jgi:hypothetical protein
MNELAVQAPVASRLKYCASAGCDAVIYTWHRHEANELIAQHGENREHRRNFECSGLEKGKGLLACIDEDHIGYFDDWLDAIHARLATRL